MNQKVSAIGSMRRDRRFHPALLDCSWLPVLLPYRASP